MFQSLKSKFTVFVVSLNIPLLILACIVLSYSVNAINTGIRKSMLELLNSKMTEINRSLEKAATSIYSMGYNSTYINNYDSAKMSTNGLFWYYQDTKLLLNAAGQANEPYISFFYYNVSNDYLILDQNSSLNGNKQPFTDHMNSLDFPGQNRAWEIVLLNDYAVLVHQIKLKDNIIGLYINLNNFLQSETLSGVNEGIYFFTDPQQSLLIAGNTKNQEIASSYLSQKSSWDGVEDLSDCGYRLNYIYPAKTIGEKLSFSVCIVLCMILLTILCVPASLFFISKYIFRPLNRLRYGLDQMQKNDLTCRINETISSAEFNSLSHSFNMMASTIQNLRTEILKTEEEKRASELSWLKHQIHPHFLLNNMNLIYTLADKSENTLIQKLSLYLSDYMRYTLKVDQSNIFLSDELKHLKDYLSILQINYPDSISFQIICKESLYRYQVPTYIINTILENSIEHAFSASHSKLDIKIKIYEGKEGTNRFLYILVSDNGIGYTEDIIHYVNNFQEFSNYFSDHIGLRNIKSRLYLMYGLADSLSISNQTDGGALTTVKIPISSERRDFYERFDR